MGKKSVKKSKEDDFVINQAINFNKLPWNRKERNFALFWPTALWFMFFCGFLLMLGKNISTINPDAIIIIIPSLVVITPLLYYAYKDYLWALVAIPVINVIITLYKCIVFGEFHWMSLLWAAFFIRPIEIELYRRKHGLTKPKNIKKDVIIGILSGLIFPIIWLMISIIRNMIK